MDMDDGFLHNRFSCAIEGCEKSFVRKEHLARHQRSTHHRADYSHTCHVCEKKFNRRLEYSSIYSLAPPSSQPFCNQQTAKGEMWSEMFPYISRAYSGSLELEKGPNAPLLFSMAVHSLPPSERVIGTLPDSSWLKHSK